MTIPEASTDIAALALALVGEFSKLQELIDGLAKLYVRKRAPGLSDFLSEQGALNRIPDRRRARLVLDIADDLGTDGDLTQFMDVFHRVRMGRNTIAHATQMERIDADTIRLSKGYLTFYGDPEEEPRTVTRQELKARLHEARWLLQHVRFISAASDLTVRQYLGTRPVAVT